MTVDVLTSCNTAPLVVYPAPSTCLKVSGSAAFSNIGTYTQTAGSKMWIQYFDGKPGMAIDYVSLLVLYVLYVLLPVPLVAFPYLGLFVLLFLY